MRASPANPARRVMPSVAFCLLWTVLVAGLAAGWSPLAAQNIRFIDVDSEQVGVRAPGDVGLPENLWQGSTRASLATAFDAVTGPSRYRVARNTLVDLLTVSAPPPDGNLAEGSLTGRRVSALAALGAGAEALALADLAPAAARDAALLDAERDVRLLRNDLAGACSLSETASSRAADADWQELRAFCRQAFGQHDEATVHAILAARAAPTPDETFASLLLGMQFPTRPVPVTLDVSAPLHWAMIRFNRWTWPSDGTVPDVSPTLLAAMSRTPRLSLPMRAQMGERALARQATDAGGLVQLYLQASETSRLGSAYRAVVFADGTAARGDALAAFWQQASAAGVFAPLAPFSLGAAEGGDLARLPPSVIAQGLRAAMVVPDVAAIADWRGALLAAALRADGAVHRDAAYAVRAMAGELDQPAQAWWPAWLAAAKPDDRQKQLVGGLMGALGDSFALAPSPRIRRNAVTRPILNAARRAPWEAAMLGLAALGQSEEPDLALQVLAVRTLAPVDIDRARALAVELAVAGGL